MTEIEACEAIRRMEMGLIAKKTVGTFTRQIREERGKWKIDTIRTNVILRNRARFREIMAKEKSGRTIDYATTINFEHRQQQRDREEMETKKRFENDARKFDDSLKPKVINEYFHLFIHFTHIQTVSDP